MKPVPEVGNRDDGDKPPEGNVLFIKVAWNKQTDKFQCESNVTGRIDIIGMLGFAKRQLLARLDLQQAQKIAQEQRIISAMKLPMGGKGPA